MTLYVGIDPGASGGLAFVNEFGEGNHTPMPDTDRDLWEWVAVFRQGGEHRTFALIEKVGGYIAGAAHPGSAMFKFGQSYGALRMALTAAGIPFEEVPPQRWQKALGVVPRGRDESKAEFKRRLRQKAQQLFPAERVTLATADALLIAEYCRRSRTGTGRPTEDAPCPRTPRTDPRPTPSSSTRNGNRPPRSPKTTRS